ncbi:MAG: transposase [candidate division Zixibacteria bacterium]|nr:transposase [candidate division Zixibacteria bacterium]
MTEERRRFDRDFKLSAVRLVESSDRPLEEMARSLGICGSMLRRWRSQVRIGGPESFDVSGHQEASEVERLRRENRRLKRDLEMLKKTMVWLQRDGKRDTRP